MCRLFTKVVFACGCEVGNSGYSTILFVLPCDSARQSGHTCRESACRIAELRAGGIKCKGHSKYETSMKLHYESMADLKRHGHEHFADSQALLNFRRSLRARFRVGWEAPLGVIPLGMGVRERWEMDVEGRESLVPPPKAKAPKEEQEDVEMGEADEDEDEEDEEGEATPAPEPASLPARQLPLRPAPRPAPTTPAPKLPTSRGRKSGVKSALQQASNCDEIRAKMYEYVGGRDQTLDALQPKLRKLARDADPYRTRRSELRTRDLTDFLGLTSTGKTPLPVLTPTWGEGKDAYLALLGLWTRGGGRGQGDSGASTSQRPAGAAAAQGSHHAGGGRRRTGGVRPGVSGVAAREGTAPGSASPMDLDEPAPVVGRKNPGARGPGPYFLGRDQRKEAEASYGLDEDEEVPDSEDEESEEEPVEDDDEEAEEEEPPKPLYGLDENGAGPSRPFTLEEAVARGIRGPVPRQEDYDSDYLPDADDDVDSGKNKEPDIDEGPSKGKGK